MSGREISGRYRALTGTNLLVAVAAALGIFVLVNYFAGLPRFRKQFDVTSVGSNTLSPKTLGILAGLGERLGKDAQGKDRVVRAVSFLTADRYPEDEAVTMVNRALDLYASHSKGRVAVEKLDAYENLTAAMARAQELKVNPADAGLVLALGDRVRTHRLDDLVRMSFGSQDFMGGGREEPPRILEDRIEDTITSSLLGLLEPEKPKILFVAGHGEPGSEETGRMGASSLAETLRKNGFETSDADLRAGIPDDARVVVWLGPKKAMTESELESLRAYVRRGGRMFVAFDPPDEPGSDADVLALLAQVGIRSPSGVVCEPIYDPLTRQLFVGHPDCAQIYVQPDNLSATHPVTKSFAEQHLAIPFVGARPLERSTEGGSTALVDELGKTTKDAWLDALPPDFRPDKESEPLGVRSVLAASTWKSTSSAASSPASAPASLLASAPSNGAHSDGNGASETREGRAIVIGSTLTLRNVNFRVGRDLALSSIEWLAGREFAAGIGPRPLRQQSLANVLAISSRTMNSLLALTFGAFAAAGLVSWRRRRQMPGLFVGLLFGAAAVVSFGLGWLA